MKEFTKITSGCVYQYFNEDGKCVRQKFVGDDIVEFEDENGVWIRPVDCEYQSYDMVQPNKGIEE